MSMLDPIINGRTYDVDTNPLETSRYDGHDHVTHLRRLARTRRGALRRLRLDQPAPRTRLDLSQHTSQPSSQTRAPALFRTFPLLFFWNMAIQYRTAHRIEQRRAAQPLKTGDEEKGLKAGILVRFNTHRKSIDFKVLSWNDH